jgi:selenide,water dikinase
MAVTGTGDASQPLRNFAGRPSVPLTLTRALGTAVPNRRHKARREVYAQVIQTRAALKRDVAQCAPMFGAVWTCDVTAFGPPGPLFKGLRASGATSVVDAAVISYLDDGRQARPGRFANGATRRNVDGLVCHTSSGVSSDELLLAEAQALDGVLLPGEGPGYPGVGNFVARGNSALIVR